MKNISKIIAVLGIFAMTIGNGFAMDNNPPTEPVKVTVETEVVEEAPQQVLMGYGYYNHDTDECVFLSVLPPSEDCSILNDGPICTINVAGVDYLMFVVTRPNTSSPWNCTIPLKKPL